MSSFDDAKFHAAIVSSMEGAHVFKQILTVCVDAYRLNSGRAFLMHLTQSEPILYINKLYRMCPNLFVFHMTHINNLYKCNYIL